MYFHIIAFLASLTSASNLPSPQHIFSNPSTSDYKIPTVHESAVQARRVLSLETIGTLSTICKSTSLLEKAPQILPTCVPQPSSLENRPSDVSGTPIGLMDYFGDCEPSTGNPTILAISIATSFKNVAAGSNITLSLRWHPPSTRPYSAAALPRFSLVGRLEELSEKEVTEQGVRGCFVKKHPDAVAWLPGNRIHESKWTRLVVEEIYWIGGFGDRAYIGWIPIEEWQSVTKEEIEGVRLPGEKGHGWGLWSSWNLVNSWLGSGEDKNEEAWEL